MEPLHFKYEIQLDGYTRYCTSYDDLYDKLRLRYGAVQRIMNDRSYIHPKFDKERGLSIRRCDYEAYPDVDFLWSYEGTVVNRDMYMW